MKVIAICSRKGGTGKTATALSLGAGLYRRGYNPLLIDLDSQANLSFSAKASGQSSIMEVLTGRVNLSKLIEHVNLFDIVPGAEDLATADTVLTDTGREYRLKEALQWLDYDFVIIDTPAALGVLTINALTASDSVVIPVQADIYSLQGLGLLQDTLETVRRYCNPALRISGVLITRYQARAVLSRDMAESLTEAAGRMSSSLYNTKIRECVAVKEAQALQLSLLDYAPRSNAAADYDAFIDEFLEREGKP